MVSDAQKAAQAKYDARTARYISLKLNTNTDRDIILWLDSQDSIQGAIKALIREKIEHLSK